VGARTPSPMPSNDTAQQRLILERDLYRELLHAGATADPRPFLEEALRCIVSATGAEQGYLALFEAGDPAKPPLFAINLDCTADDSAVIQRQLSHGIIGQALRQKVTISTASALEDPRFRTQRSVASGLIRAVLCAPIGDTGALYLQGRPTPGPFEERDRQLLEDFARQVSPYAERLLEATPHADPTQRYRDQLKGLEQLAGRSQALAELFAQVALIAPREVSVLILGPSGAGKTALARAIHLNSPRAGGPLIELNCAALPEQLLESELFGAERGAHSTADRTLPGKVEAASGGTLLLDEIGELPLSSQAKLLQFLQSKTYFRLGGQKARSADVRIITATNVDLEAAVRTRRFREDLYYRLAVLPLRVPSLEARPTDIMPIAEALLIQTASRHNLPSPGFSSASRAALKTAQWPGNIRQLANAIEAGLIRAAGETATQLEPQHLFPGQPPTEVPRTFQAATRAFQRRLIADTLSELGWNVSEAARILDVARSHLNELIRAFGLKRPPRP